MKKKILQLVAVFVAALTGQPALAQTEFTVGDFTYQVLEDDPTAVALKQAAATIEGAVVIPSAVENEEEVTYTVKQILGYAFNSTGITSVTIPAQLRLLREPCQHTHRGRRGDSDTQQRLLRHIRLQRRREDRLSGPQPEGQRCRHGLWQQRDERGVRRQRD